MKAKKPQGKTEAKTLSDTLKAAIEQHGGTYRAAKDSGVSYPVLLRFVGGTRDIRLATAERLVKVLGLELRAIGAKEEARGKPKEGRQSTKPSTARKAGR